MSPPSAPGIAFLFPSLCPWDRPTTVNTSAGAIEVGRKRICPETHPVLCSNQRNDKNNLQFWTRSYSAAVCVLPLDWIFNARNSSGTVLCEMFFATESIHVYLSTPLQPSSQAQAWMISLKGPSRISKDSRSKTKHFAVLDFTSCHTISATPDRFMPLKSQNFRLSFGRAAITVAPRFSFSSRACFNTPFKSLVEELG